jgi:hypothetical protein
MSKAEPNSERWFGAITARPSFGMCSRPVTVVGHTVRKAGLRNRRALLFRLPMIDGLIWRSTGREVSPERDAWGPGKAECTFPIPD